MKKIVIYTGNGAPQKQRQWAKEAAEEFISIFPEYKDSFKIELRSDADLSGKEITPEQYNALPATSNKNEYIKASNGNWLVPYRSMEWYMLSSRLSDGSNKIDVAKMTTLQSTYVVNVAKDEIPLCLVNNELIPCCYGYTGGVTKQKNGKVIEGNSIVVSAGACQNDKELIKTIFIHELGHVFNATHQNRPRTIMHNGPHCTNDLCIMGDSNYPELRDERLRRKARGKPPFCNDCITSMREYMSRMPELERHVQSQQIPAPQQQTAQPVSRPIIMPTGLPSAPLPSTEQWNEFFESEPHNGREWKNDIREFYKNVAIRDGDTYKENIQSQNYVARIKRADGSTLEIQASNEFNISLGATNPNGDNVPSLKDMRDLVKLTQQKNSGMNFGENNEPEFNGRLLIACLEAQPKPLAMQNRPQITPEFLANLQPSTRQHLQTLINNPLRQRSQNTR